MADAASAATLAAVRRPKWMPPPPSNSLQPDMRRQGRRFHLVTYAQGEPYESSMSGLGQAALRAGFDAVHLWTKEMLLADPLSKQHIDKLRDLDERSRFLRKRKGHPYRPYCDIFKPISVWRALAESKQGDYVLWADSSKYHLNQSIDAPVQQAATCLRRSRRCAQQPGRSQLSTRWSQSPWYLAHAESPAAASSWRALNGSAYGLMECSPSSCEHDLFKWNSRGRAINMITAHQYADLIPDGTAALFREPGRLLTNFLLENTAHNRLLVWDWLWMALAKPEGFCNSWTQDQAAFAILARNRSLPLINQCVYLRISAGWESCGRHSQKVNTFLDVLGRGAFEVVQTKDYPVLQQDYVPIAAAAGHNSKG
jgi:hypothetical protein